LPGQQFSLVGVGGELVDGVDARPDRDVLPEHPHLPGIGFIFRVCISVSTSNSSSRVPNPPGNATSALARNTDPGDRRVDANNHPAMTCRKLTRDDPTQTSISIEICPISDISLIYIKGTSGFWPHAQNMSNPAANPQEVLKPGEQGSGLLPSTLTVFGPTRRTIEGCERELIQYRAMEIRLRDALAESEEQLRQKDELLQRQALLKKESDHRLLNDLQMTISLLTLQSRGSTNVEAARQLAVAANRVAMIARIHHRLNSYEGAQTIEFKQFLADFSRDFSAMVASEDSPEQFVVEGIEVNLPSATAIPLGFIASELITNAAKYGKSRIAIRLEQSPDPQHRYALSVYNDGPSLPEGFDPGASKGLGMRIIQSFTRQIGGELRFGRNDDDEGARFTVLFS